MLIVSGPRARTSLVEPRQLLVEGRDEELFFDALRKHLRAYLLEAPKTASGEGEPQQDHGR